MSPSAVGALLRDLAERAARAFVSTFLGALLLGLSTVVSVPSAWALLAGAFGAGVSAVVSLFAGVTGVKGSASLRSSNTGETRR